MTFDPSIYQARQYPTPPCWALVADVYARERAQAVDTYKTVNASIRAIATAFRLQLHKGAHGFAQVDEPQDLCVVLLGRTLRLGPHHAGVYWQGSVLHALDAGVMFQDLASVRDVYGLVEFWAQPANESTE